MIRVLSVARRTVRNKAVDKCRVDTHGCWPAFVSFGFHDLRISFFSFFWNDRTGVRLVLKTPCSRLVPKAHTHNLHVRAPTQLISICLTAVVLATFLLLFSHTSYFPADRPRRRLWCTGCCTGSRRTRWRRSCDSAARRRSRSARQSSKRSRSSPSSLRRSRRTARSAGKSPFSLWMAKRSVNFPNRDKLVPPPPPLRYVPREGGKLSPSEGVGTRRYLSKTIANHKGSPCCCGFTSRPPPPLSPPSLRYVPLQGMWKPFWVGAVTSPRSTPPTRRRGRERSVRLPTRPRRGRRPTCSSSLPPTWPPGLWSGGIPLPSCLKSAHF